MKTFEPRRCPQFELSGGYSHRETRAGRISEEARAEMNTGGHVIPIQLSLGLRPASTADQQMAHFHRDSDRRRLRAMLAGVAATGVVVVLVLGLVGLRMQQVRLSYRLDTLRTAKAGAEELNRRLRVEKASLQSLARIELEARSRLGMVVPTRQQVQLAREFAGAGTASTTLGERTAAAAVPVREEVR